MKLLMRVVLQWVFAAIAALIVGPIAGWATALNHGVDGSGDATMLVGASVATGVLGHAVALALAGGLGLVASRVLGGRYGLFTAGVVLTWAAARTGRVETILSAQPETGTVVSLMIEGGVLAAAAAALAWLICRDKEHENPAQQEKALSGETLLGLAAALVAGGLGAWLAARDDIKGQTIAAAWVAGALGATLARVLAHRTPGWSVVLGACLCGVVGPALAVSVAPEKLLIGMYSGGISSELLSLMRVAPLDWIAGVFMGVPVGMSWAGSMMEKRVAESDASGKASLAKTGVKTGA